jgi:hypothetical protein
VSAQMRRTSIYSIPPGIQRPGAISQGDIRSELLIPSPRQKECHHVHLYSEAFDECCRGTCRALPCSVCFLPLQRPIETTQPF